MKYDLLVIGSGPAGQKGAIAAAKMGRRVALVERQDLTGGVCLHTGTIPSKTMREAILYLTGYRQRKVYSDRYYHKRDITMEDLRVKLSQVTQTELEVIRDQLKRNGVDAFQGEARFVGPHEVEVRSLDDRVTSLEAENILIATGTKPARPSHIPFDGTNVFDSDEVLKLDHIPRSMVVVGGGVIGIEYAIMFATLGVHVTVVDGRKTLLDFCDHEIVDTLLYHCRALGMTFRLGEEVTEIHKLDQQMVVLNLESGKRLVGESILFCVGRSGDTAGLNLEAAGLKADKRGRVGCDENHRTDVYHIYGVGDVVGFPALASTSMEQGRRAICAIFGKPFEPCEHMPYGLFTIPEISMVGKSEEQLTEERVPYEVGTARYREIARGHIVGDTHGILKILFHRETREILGVHCIGESATEILHIGQAVMRLGGTLDYFRDTVFNYPTMAECYKVAAFDGFNKLAFDEIIKEQAEQRKLDSIAQDMEASDESIEDAVDGVAETGVINGGDVEGSDVEESSVETVTVEG